MNNIEFSKTDSEAYNWIINNLDKLSDKDFTKVQNIITRLYNIDSRLSMLKALEYSLSHSAIKVLVNLKNEYNNLKNK